MRPKRPNGMTKFEYELHNYRKSKYKEYDKGYVYGYIHAINKYKHTLNRYRNTQYRQGYVMGVRAGKYSLLLDLLNTTNNIQAKRREYRIGVPTLNN